MAKKPTRLLLIAFAMISGCASPPKASLAPPNPDEDRSDSGKTVRIDFNFRTSESANILDILDCTSDLMDGFCDDDGAYRVEWEKIAKIDKRTEEALEAWAEVRKRHYNDPDGDEKDPSKNRNGLFMTLGALDADPIAHAFYEASSADAALEALQKRLSLNERATLLRTIESLRPVYSSWLFESTAFDVPAGNTARKLMHPKYWDYLAEVARFYGVGGKISYTVLWNWWPPIKRDNATPTGPYLVLRKNPRTQLNWSDDDIIFHEVVHTISARQALPRKRELTKAFLAECRPDGIKKGKILEEPLAVAIGQMLYLERFFPKRFKSEQNWYADPWVDGYARVLYPLVKEYFSARKSIDVDFMQRAGRLCREHDVKTKS